MPPICFLERNDHRALLPDFHIVENFAHTARNLPAAQQNALGLSLRSRRMILDFPFAQHSSPIVDKSRKSVVFPVSHGIPPHARRPQTAGTENER